MMCIAADSPTTQMQATTAPYPVDLGTDDFLFTAGMYPRVCQDDGSATTACVEAELVPGQ